MGASSVSSAIRSGERAKAALAAAVVAMNSLRFIEPENRTFATYVSSESSRSGSGLRDVASEEGRDRVGGLRLMYAGETVPFTRQDQHFVTGAELLQQCF